MVTQYNVPNFEAEQSTVKPIAIPTAGWPGQSHTNEYGVFRWIHRDQNLLI